MSLVWMRLRRFRFMGSEHLAWHLARLLAASVLVVVAAGCQGGNRAAPADTRAATADGTEQTVATELTLPAYELYGPVSGEGALWLRDVVTGKVFRVDAEKHALTVTIDIGPGCCLGVGEGAVWATVPDKKLLLPLRIDPTSNTTTAQITLGELAE